MNSIVLFEIFFDALKLMAVAIFMGVMGSIALMDTKQKDPATGKYKKKREVKMSLLKSILSFFFVSKETKQLMKEIEVNSEKEKFLNDLRLSEERQKKKQGESPKNRPSPSYSVVRSHGGRKIEQKNDDRGRGHRDDYTPASFLFGGDVGSGDSGDGGGGDGGGSCGGGGE